MPYILCGGHTITTNNDGTFYINVQSPNGKKADYAAYTIGPFGTGFGQAGEYTAQRWDTSDVNQIRFRLWNTKDNRWCGRVAIRKLDRNLEQAIVFPNPAFHDMASTVQQQQRFAYAHR